MVTPRTCRLCPKPCRKDSAYPLCEACWGAFGASGEGERLAAIDDEPRPVPMLWIRQDGCVEDFITRVLAEREVERGRA